MPARRTKYEDLLVLKTKNGSIKISVWGTCTPKEMYQASEHMLVLAGKTHAKEKNGG